MRILDVECSQCRVQPGEECTGPGDGYHLSRFDRLDDVHAGQAPPTYTPATRDLPETSED